MVWCGIEEPLQSNEQLLAIDEQRRVLRLADFGEPAMCRYSFTHLEGEVWPELLDAIAKQFHAAPRGVLIWKHEQSGDFRMRSQVRLARLRRQGFSTKVLGTVGLGVAPFTGVEPSAFHPVGVSFHPAGDGALILVDCDEAVEALFGTQAESSTLVEAGSSFRLTPSREFLSWLATVSLRVLYLSWDQLERPGLVLLSHDKFDVGGLVNDGLIDHIESGSRASCVWTSQ